MTLGITALTYTAFMVASLPTQVISAFSLSQVQFGAVTTVPFLAGAVLGLPIGMMGDRIGVKHVVTACLVVALVGTVVRLFLGGFAALFVGNFAIGMWWASLSPAAKAWTIIGTVVIVGITVAAITDDEEKGASPF